MEVDLASRRRTLARMAEASLVRYRWPGNVRELQNVLFRAALRARGPSIGPGDLALAMPTEPTREEPSAASRVLAIAADGGELTCADVVAGCALSRATAKRLLRALVDAGDLAAVGQGKATRYRRRTSEDLVDSRQNAILTIIRREGRITRLALAREAGLSLRTAGRTLAELVAAGRIAPDGRKGNSGGYVLPSRVQGQQLA